MDFAVWVRLDDDIERRVHVDDVLAVEMPFDPELHGGNVLVSRVSPCCPVSPR